MTIAHKSTGKTDADLLQCDAKEIPELKLTSKCSKNTLRSAFRFRGKHICKNHYIKFREILQKNKEKLEV